MSLGRSNSVLTWGGPVLVAALALLPAAAAIGGNPTIGEQVRVDVTGNEQWTNETTASASELFPDRIVAGWNDYRDVPNIRSGFALSFDGGASWSDFLLRPPLGFQASVEGDPMSAYDDRTGTLWASAISFSGSGGIYVARLDPGETELNDSVMAETGFVDKCWMAAGPLPGQPETTRVYIAYSEGMISSDDMGDTWTNPVSLGSGIGFLPRVGPNGEVYVAYWDFGSGVKMKRSLNGGLSFTTHTIATRMDVWETQSGDRFPSFFRVPSLNYLDVDQETGDLYAVYFDTTNIVNGQSNVDIYFTKSDNKGSTWDTPVVINEDNDPPGDQFFPWIERDHVGRTHVMYLDSRNVVQNDNSSPGWFDAYYSFSEDDGATWTEFRLTPETWSSGGTGFLGDYSAMTTSQNQVVPVYVQMDNGDQRIYSNIIEFGDDTCPWDCADGDGFVTVQDFLALIAQWGQNTACDFNGNGVDIVDMLELLANWGVCP